MDVLRLGRCSHEFSWPRRAADGHYYQVCLLCAVEYKYDWATMRRTERVALTVTEPGARRRTREKKPTWVPRARRLKLNLAVRYRVKNLNTWSVGTIENISQSGVLFQGTTELPVNAWSKWCSRCRKRSRVSGIAACSARGGSFVRRKARQRGRRRGHAGCFYSRLQVPASELTSRHQINAFSRVAPLAV